MRFIRPKTLLRHGYHTKIYDYLLKSDTQTLEGHTFNVPLAM